MTARDDLRQGWCPTFTRPMETGDGWLVRLHIKQSMLAAKDARVIAESATRFGNGHMDLTSRGNVQIRGVTPERYEALFAALSSLNVLQEERPPRSILSEQPALGALPHDTIGLGLPFGRMDSWGLLWLADAAETYGNGMIRLSGQRAIFIEGVAIAKVEKILHEAAIAGFITETEDARRMIESCPGAPACHAAQGPTRALGLAIAEHFPKLASSGQKIHVSGCIKGCAYASKAAIAITANGSAYNMALDATADAVPHYRALSQDTVLKQLEKIL